MPPQTTSATSAAALPDALPYPLTDNGQLIDMISHVLDKPQDEVRERLYQAELSPTEFFQREYTKLGIEPYVWCEELEAFYQDTDVYLIGGTVWNRKPYKAMLRKWIASYLAEHRSGPQRILTVGDGVGFDSLYLSQCGHEVTYSELSEKCIRFASQLFEITNEPVTVLDNLDDIEKAGYDVVLCLDVLEHVPEPSELVGHFARYLRPGGTLIVHAPFYFVSQANPTHLDSNRKYSGDIRQLYGQHGFSLEGGRLFWDPLVLVQGTPQAPQQPIWNMALQATGALFSVGRYWCTPHNMIAERMVGKGEPRWLEGLATEKR